MWHRTIISYGAQDGNSGSAVIDDDGKLTGIVFGYQKADGSNWAHVVWVEDVHAFLEKAKGGDK